MIDKTLKTGELYLITDKKPKVDPMIDKYAVLAKFMNQMNISGDILFEITKSEFIEIQKRLNQIETKISDDELVDIIELNAEGRIFKFKIKE